jgi:hypothetical protein
MGVYTDFRRIGAHGVWARRARVAAPLGGLVGTVVLAWEVAGSASETSFWMAG